MIRAFSFPASPERSRLRAWLEGTLAGLCELHLLRERQERRVRQALRIAAEPAGAAADPSPEEQQLVRGKRIGFMGLGAARMEQERGRGDGEGGGTALATPPRSPSSPTPGPDGGLRGNGPLRPPVAWSGSEKAPSPPLQARWASCLHQDRGGSIPPPLRPAPRTGGGVPGPAGRC
uniref:Uncharacterized protein n=1 Tax=Laticauda laticaudata TaxID=8630 RepID=A0A8C5SPF2_LATLA